MEFERKMFWFMTSRYINRNARKVWGSKQLSQIKDQKVITSSEIERVLASSWEIYANSPLEIQKTTNLGNWLVIHSGHLTLAAYQALRENGFDKETSIALMSKLTWYITSTWAERGKRLTNIFIRDKMKELQLFVNIVMKTMFSPPAYKFEHGEMENGFYLDVLHCPVAELMKSRGKPDLCIESWCGVDFGLVEIFDGELKRSGTIAMGEEMCDFRFYSRQNMRDLHRAKNSW